MKKRSSSMGQLQVPSTLKQPLKTPLSPLKTHTHKHTLSLSLEPWMLKSPINTHLAPTFLSYFTKTDVYEQSLSLSSVILFVL